MQLGLFMQPVHDTRRDYTEILEQDRQTVILADKLGFRECWIGEHIAATTEPITSPLVFLASLLQETKQIQLGTGVFCLSIKHPAVVAAEAAMFDHLARGRFQMGIGTGGLSSDLELFKVAGDVDRGRMMRESIDMILKLWAGQPPYELKGEFWDISILDTSRSEFGVGSLPKPYQKPHPPLAVSLLSPGSGSAYAAGERGYIPISGASLVQPRYIASHWENYLEGAAAAGRKAEPSIWRVARSILITESETEATDLIADPDGPFRYFYRYMMSAFAQRGVPHFLRPDGREEAADVEWHEIALSMLAYGTSRTVLDKLVWLRDVVGGFGVLTLTAHEFHDAELHEASMRRLVEEVMPRFRQHMSALRAA